MRTKRAQSWGKLCVHPHAAWIGLVWVQQYKNKNRNPPRTFSPRCTVAQGKTRIAHACWYSLLTSYWCRSYSIIWSPGDLVVASDDNHVTCSVISSRIRFVLFDRPSLICSQKNGRLYKKGKTKGRCVILDRGLVDMCMLHPCILEYYWKVDCWPTHRFSFFSP